MKTQGLNLFIVDADKAAGVELKKFLENRFGSTIHISVFTDGKNCLEEIESDTHLVILTCSPDDKQGLELLKAIKAENSLTEVAMLTEKNSIASAIESYEAGAKSIIVKDANAQNKVNNLVAAFFMAPIRIIVKESGLSQRLAIFLMTFLTIGLILLIVVLLKH
jgi:DNA-binding NtrC family response regulator